ncbi:hypothetical protein PCE1_002703 [Barthelona sp. PCE]
MMSGPPDLEIHTDASEAQQSISLFELAGSTISSPQPNKPITHMQDTNAKEIMHLKQELNTMWETLDTEGLAGESSEIMMPIMKLLRLQTNLIEKQDIQIVNLSLNQYVSDDLNQMSQHIVTLTTDFAELEEEKDVMRDLLLENQKLNQLSRKEVLSLRNKIEMLQLKVDESERIKENYTKLKNDIKVLSNDHSLQMDLLKQGNSKAQLKTQCELEEVTAKYEQSVKKVQNLTQGIQNMKSALINRDADIDRNLQTLTNLQQSTTEELQQSKAVCTRLLDENKGLRERNRVLLEELKSTLRDVTRYKKNILEKDRAVHGWIEATTGCHNGGHCKNSGYG